MVESRQEFLDAILRYNSNYDTELIGKAYDLAVKMHNGQMRKSGEPYIIHPIAVAKILADIGMDESTIIGGLLHDVVEDTEYTKEQLAEIFGDDVALIVDGVTKITNIQLDTKEAKQAETLRKMFFAMSKDIRVLIVKLADRLHNLRTIGFMKPEKIKEKCNETLEIYSPLASRLGLFQFKMEYEDICLKNLWPEDYNYLTRRLKEKEAENVGSINKIIEGINSVLEDSEIDYTIYGRIKHHYSIYRKMKNQNKQFSEIFDLFAVRIIVDSIKDCYAVLGLVHSMWTPIPGRFKDYIAMPKPNMYQSIHTTVIGEKGLPFEIQIRTKEMHKIAEYGIAAHWKYKEGVKADENEEKLSWLRQSLEWQKELDNPNEFLDTLKMDLFENEVFVFTPRGDVMELPAGATPLDFAFKVHSHVGAKCVGAKVNGKMVTIDHALQNGDIIEIITNPNASGPSMDWLKIVKSSTARTKIRQWIKRENKSDGIEKGKESLEKYLKKKGYNAADVMKNANIAKTVKELNLRDTDELYMQISNGGTVVANAAAKLLAIYQDELDKKNKKDDNKADSIEVKKSHQKEKINNNRGVVVNGMEGLLVKMSKCCNPVPGDSIVGFVTKGNGVSIHRKDCPNIESLPLEERARMIDVSWEENTSEIYEADITICGEDRKGLFSELSKVCTNADTNIMGVNARTDHDGNATVILTVEISNIDQIGKLMLALKGVPGVYEVYRNKI
ncbi:MAG: bifunctional (p)ppGpp synthetase/guanosine-3',5'-bis(diphosphate) 3'-pyrophosphohydrolase [Eubacterium sp.]|nr:bifunctional (p)ppGpp synthetase/guanosine-3',5'-bis(diphosphate) 3'-pyrophosphohydrolase [Eubacterium sp.]